MSEMLIGFWGKQFIDKTDIATPLTAGNNNAWRICLGDLVQQVLARAEQLDTENHNYSVVECDFSFVSKISNDYVDF